jgi:MFS family permease
MYLALYPYILYILCKAKSVQSPTLTEDTGKTQIRLSLLLSKPRFLFGLLSQMMVMMST